MNEISQITQDLHETAKTLDPLIMPAIKAAVKGILTPRLEQFQKSKELSKKISAENIEVSFQEYLRRLYLKLSYINTLVFGNQQKRLQDLYLPLTVYCSQDANVSFRIDGWNDGFIPAIKRVIITDTAGMGKSTILKWLFLCALGKGDRIPIFIELRALTKTKK